MFSERRTRCVKRFVHDGLMFDTEPVWIRFRTEANFVIEVQTAKRCNQNA